MLLNQLVTSQEGAIRVGKQEKARKTASAKGKMEKEIMRWPCKSGTNSLSASQSVTARVWSRQPHRLRVRVRVYEYWNRVGSRNARRTDWQAVFIFVQDISSKLVTSVYIIVVSDSSAKLKKWFPLVQSWLSHNKSSFICLAVNCYLVYNYNYNYCTTFR